MSSVTRADWIEIFAPIKWATPYLTSPEWRVRTRDRGAGTDKSLDVFCNQTLKANDGLQLWLELYKRPSKGSTTVAKCVVLCKFGLGLGGFPGIAHGGSLMSLMDEALALAMIATETEKRGDGEWQGVSQESIKALKDRRPVAEVLKGYLVTAKLEMKFLQPVICPGIVGIEVDTLEDKGYRMIMRGVMKDGDGRPLLQADGIWVRIGGGSKL
jgi:acyl-coenzyme A thioesterase PaaI-like protein